MIDIRDYIAQVTKDAPYPVKAIPGNVADFLERNNWFGDEPVFKDGTMYLTERQVDLFTPPILRYLSRKGNGQDFVEMLIEKYPETANYLLQFYDELDYSDETRIFVTDFLLMHLHNELSRYTNKEVSDLVRTASEVLIKAHGDILTFFVGYLKETAKTAYTMDFVMQPRYKMDIQSEAYSLDEYLSLLYQLFNEDAILDNSMMTRALDSKDYADTWLYLALHCVCALRFTDLVRIHHPVLPYSADEVLEKIRFDEFTDEEAREVLLSITRRMCILPFSPSKTSAYENVPYVKFVVPVSCEVLLGTLFAICESHWQIEQREQLKETIGQPLIRKINTYKQISSYMGDEIGELFRENDFRARSANKSYLQSIYSIADEALPGEKGGPKIKGYLLAALARSHKGSYAEFCETTAEYIKDFNMYGMTPSMVAFELLERGVLSCIPAMLLKLVDERYGDLSFTAQTKALSDFNLTPLEAEATTAIIAKSRHNAALVVKEVAASGKDILSVLHSIGCGDAYAKEPECLCLCTAINKVCPYPERSLCVGCKYEISTKSTLLLMLSEYSRMAYLNKREDCTSNERLKNRKIVEEFIIPKITELLSAIRDIYGDDAYKDYSGLVRRFLQR